MTEIEMKTGAPEVTDELCDELSDEALDRTAGESDLMSCGGNWTAH